MLEQMTTDKAGWAQVAFGDLVEKVSNSGIPDAEESRTYIGLEHMSSDSYRILTWGSDVDIVVSKTRIKKGDVLFARRNTHLRRCAVAPFDTFFSPDGYAFRAKSERLSQEYLLYLVASTAFMDFAVSNSAGTHSKRVKWTDLQKFEFLLPPIQEQARLVEALSAIDDAIEKFDVLSKTIQAMVVPLLRSFVGISGAVDEADLINGVRTKTLSNVPLVRVEELGTKERQAAQVGPFGGSVSRKHFAKTGTPILKINNLTELGSLDLTDQVFLMPEQAKSLAARYSVSEGDLVTAAQATIGRSALVTKEVEGAIISQHLIRVAVDKEMCRPDWLLSWFLSPFVLRQIFGAVQGGTRAGLNTEDVANLRLPIPQIKQQDAYLEKLATCRTRQALTSMRSHNLRQVRSMMLSEIEP